MKNSWRVAGLLAVLLIGACSSPAKPKQKEHAEEKETIIQEEAIPEKDVRAELTTLLVGEWASDPFFRKVEKTKSVYPHRECTTELFGFGFAPGELKKKNPLLSGWVIHEGGYDCRMRFDEAKQLLVCDSDFNRNAFEVRVIDDKTVEFFYPKRKRTDRYRKVGEYKDELRRILIEGTYTLDGKTVTLGRKGNVKGFKNYRNYEVICDFTEGVEADAVIFFEDPKGGNWSQGTIYYYTISGRSISLRLLQTDWDTYEHRLTDEVLELKRR